MATQNPKSKTRNPASRTRRPAPRAYDFVVIGGGSAGFNAARAAAALGLRTAVVDGARTLGGLCILRGCMPSKTLLYAADQLFHARHGDAFGLVIPRARADMRAIHARKKRIIGEFAGYRLRQLKAGQFDLVRKAARFRDSHTLELADGSLLRGKRFLIATGSTVSLPAIPGLARAGAWTSDDVLDLDFIPPSVIVLGGGIVACELSQFLSRIGARVVMIQRSAHVLRDHSPEAAAVVQQAFRDEGIALYAGTRIRGVMHDRSGFAVEFEHAGKTVTRRARHLSPPGGGDPNPAGLLWDAAGVKTTAAGRVIVNRWQQSSQPHIYAAGDVCGPHEIVHLAIAQGELAARHAAGAKGLRPIDDSLLLNVVFTDPQVATLGPSEHALHERGIRTLSAAYPFDDHGRSILMEAKYGYVKIVAEPERGRILGAEIVGKDAGELIHCLSGPLAMGATVGDLLRAPWYHPTLAEIITYPLEEIAAQVKRG